MASVAAQRTGLITATVVSVIVALTALVFAFIFSAKASRAETDQQALERKYNGIVRSNALTGPVVTQLKERGQTAPYTGSEPLLDVAVGERDELTKVLGGTTPAVAITSTRTALKSASEAMKSAGLGELNTQDNASASLQQLATAVQTLAQQKADAVAQAKASKEEASKTIAANSEAMAANAKAMEDVRRSVGEQAAALNKDREGMQGVIAAGTETFNKTYQSQAEAAAKMTSDLAESRRLQDNIQKQIVAAQKRLGLYRPDAEQSIIRQADGTITKVGSTKTVYISLGAGQQVTPGMTFEVYPASSGVPALKTSDEVTMPQGKASIEVIRVDANGSECRVISTKLGQTITEGDVVANLVYDRNTKYNFAVFGKFDLTTKGKPSADDANTIKRLVSEFGGKTVDKIAVGTDFLVIGNEPQIPEYTSEESRDPINAKEIADAQAELEAYNAVVAKAKELSIPVLNQNRFLYYVGYYDKARR